MIALAALLLAAGHAVGADTIPVEAFARHPEINEARLSPDGRHVAIAVPSADGNETTLRVVSLETGDTRVLRYGNRNHVSDVVWSDDGRIVMSRATMDPLRARPYSLGELISADIDGRNQEVLFAHMEATGGRRGKRDDDGFAWVAKVLDKEPGKILVSFACWNCGEDPDAVVYKVDTATGRRQEVERVRKRASFIFDQDGVARIAVGVDANDEPRLTYRRTAGAGWEPVPAAIAGYSIEEGRFADDGNTLYALVSDAREPRQLYRIDLAAGTRTRLAGRPDVEISRLLYGGRNGIPFAARYDAYKPSVDYIDPQSEWAQLHTSLLGMFPGEMVQFIDTSRDGRKILFFAWSDRHPGAYYLYDRDARRAKLVQDVMPWIDAAKMTRVRPIEFTARDGTLIHGFLTAAGTGARPLVVLPHGGPHGVHDSWSFDPDVQFLASRGYSVLQVNYRGSDGRGQAFTAKGFREWGGAIQDDIADGVKWAIDIGHAETGRACTFGASFGGYSALMNPIRNPGMYACAAGYVGVYDLGLMYKRGNIQRSNSGLRYLDRVLGTDPSLLSAQSPAQNVDKIGIPVLLVHGALDTQVPMDQFNAMRKAFERTGKPAETLVAKDEGHGFYAPKNRAELYGKLEAFLGRHLPAKTP